MQKYPDNKKPESENKPTLKERRYIPFPGFESKVASINSNTSHNLDAQENPSH